MDWGHALEITSHDEDVLGHKRGEHEGQQGFEALGLLVAMRIWAPLWRDKRVKLHIRNDNVGALTVFSSCKGKSVPMNAIAREYALDIADGVHEPDLVQHLPGICNVVADSLSRRTDPAYAKTWTLPTFLVNAKHVHPPTRDNKWWKATIPPGYTTSTTKGGDDDLVSTKPVNTRWCQT